MTKPSSDFEQTKRIMGVLVRMPPKPHDEMKLGKRRKAKRKARVKRASATASSERN
jgi:hypothetical protein